MAKLQRDAERERRWREVLSRQASSGLSVRDSCRREGVKEASFYAWRRTIGERDGESTPAFLPVAVSDPAKGELSIAIELIGGRVLKLPTTTPAAWLAELLLALEARPER